MDSERVSIVTDRPSGSFCNADQASRNLSRPISPHAFPVKSKGLFDSSGFQGRARLRTGLPEPEYPSICRLRTPESAAAIALPALTVRIVKRPTATERLARIITAPWLGGSLSHTCDSQAWLQGRISRICPKSSSHLRRLPGTDSAPPG